MDSFMLAASVVIPLVVYMVIGGIVKKLNMFSQENFKALNGLIFKIMIPLALFFEVYHADIGDVAKPALFAFVEVSILTIFGVTWLVITKFVPENKDASVMIQGIYRSNFVLFGTMIASSLCGDAGMAVVAALSATVVPTFNILAVLLFEIKRGGSFDLKKLFIGILKNPLVDAGVLGLLFNLLRIPIPMLLADPLTKLGSAATPVALVALGGMLSFDSIAGHTKYLTVAVIARLVIIPLIIISISVALGFRGDVLVAMLAIFGSPTAVASNPMAHAMGGNGILAGEIVAASTVCSVVSIFMFVFTLSSMGMI